MELATLPLLATLLASGDEGTSTGAAVMQYGILLLIPVAMYFLLIRPQRKRARDQAAMQSALGVGDEVITTSGVYGFITGEEADPAQGDDVRRQGRQGRRGRGGRRHVR
jgi:preprotein translocase YajC subunit